MKSAQNAHEVLLRKNSLLVPELFAPGVSLPAAEPDAANYFGSSLSNALALQVNVESLGFAFKPDAIRSLSYTSEEDLASLYKWLIPSLKKMVGANRKFEPMYPNFPKQVMEASDYELLYNATRHYAGDWLGTRILPEFVKKRRGKFDETIKPRLIDVAPHSAFDEKLVNLMNANTSLSEDDKGALVTLFNYAVERKTIEGILVSDKTSIAQKETLAFVSDLVLKGGLPFVELMEGQFRTATDVLRFAVARSGGDISLSGPPRFGNFSRPERRLLLSLVDRIVAKGDEQVLENMFGNRESWLRLGERLHPREYEDKFPSAARAFADLRANNKPPSLAGKVDVALNEWKIEEAVKLLTARPGQLARGLNRLLKRALLAGQDGKNVLAALDSVAGNISTPVLLQVWNHMKRQSGKTLRAVVPKGVVSNVHIIEEEYQPLPEVVASAAATICRNALTSRFRGLPPMGKVYVDPAIKKINAPFAGRSASESLKTLPRGSRIPDESGEASIVRYFLWWKEGEGKSGQYTGRVDIDLSVVLLNEEYKVIEHCSYYNLRGRGMTHSGDITSAPEGACEFIDIEKGKLSRDVAYVAMVINSYTSQPYSDLPECFAGWQIRDNPKAGKIFDGRAVKNRIDLSSDARSVMPMVIDIKANEVIWMDMALTSTDIYATNSVHHQKKGLSAMVQGVVNLDKPTLGDLLDMHIDARGVRVATKEEADVVFAMDEGIMPHQSDKIAADFMADPVKAPPPAVVPVATKKPKAKK